jgi:hypothetical protein
MLRKSKWGPLWFLTLVLAVNVASNALIYYANLPAQRSAGSFYFPDRWWGTISGGSCGVPANIDAFVTCWVTKSRLNLQ